MEDHICTLCGKLVRAEDQREFKPVAVELRRAIRDRIDCIREHVVGIALFDRILDLNVFASGTATGSTTEQRLP